MHIKGLIFFSPLVFLFCCSLFPFLCGVVVGSGARGLRPLAKDEVEETIADEYRKVATSCIPAKQTKKHTHEQRP